jgi:hypothetical protein
VVAGAPGVGDCGLILEGDDVSLVEGSASSEIDGSGSRPSSLMRYSYPNIIPRERNKNTMTRFSMKKLCFL